MPIYGILSAATLAFALTASSAYASAAYSPGFDRDRRAFDQLSRDSASTRHQWLRLIESFLTIHKTAKDHRTRVGSLRYAGRASLGLYHCNRRPEDLDRAIRLFKEYNRIVTPARAVGTKAARSNGNPPWTAKAATGPGSRESSRVRARAAFRGPRTGVNNGILSSTALEYILPRRNGQNRKRAVNRRFPSVHARTGNPYVPDQAEQSHGNEHWRGKGLSLLPSKPPHTLTRKGVVSSRDFHRKLRSKKYSVQVRDRVSKSPLTPLFQRGGPAPPPFNKGGQGGFLPSGLEPYVSSLKAHWYEVTSPNPATDEQPGTKSADPRVKTPHGEQSVPGTRGFSAPRPKVRAPIRTASVIPNAVMARPGNPGSTDGLSKRFLVVIDPGHGGKDSGAVSRDGRLKEKDVTLRIAMRLKKLLNTRNRRVRVVLTRSDDRFLALEERTALANVLNADLFVSIHCNAGTDSDSRGLETYYLSTTSCTKALEVAARENNIPLDRMSDLQATLLDLTMQSKRSESDRLAKTVHRHLVRRLARLLGPNGDRGVKRAPFNVLLGAKMPSVLVECAFISNPGEARRLRDPRYLNILADGIARGADSYLKSLYNVAQRKPR